MKWRVEAQILVTKTFEADTEERAIRKMEDYLSDNDVNSLDWCMDVYKICDLTDKPCNNCNDSNGNERLCRLY